ncbi:MAG: hypothetical protein CSA49_02305 [Gammaproteobacteria bacterium]|nr:MAG: hypothetical protein CSA49_02305 [Gammaproteobacteria bacterium]
MRTVEQFANFSWYLRKSYVNKVTQHPYSDDLEAILKQYPKLVIAMNHGPMSGPLAGTVGMMNQYYKHGGKNRKPVVIAWRGFYKVPLFKYVIQYMSQVRNPPNLDGFAKKLTNGQATDVFVMPEGENCSFGNGLDIEPFLSPRFVELALKAETPILVAVHVGSELWSKIIPVSKRLNPALRYLPQKSYERIKHNGRINLGLYGLKKIPDLQMCFKLYRPGMTLEDLNKPNGQKLLQQESDNIRELMQLIVDIVSGKKQPT